MGNDFDAKFRQQLAVIEKNLLALDSSSIGDFNHQWTTLVHDLRVAMDSESLSSTTVKAAHSLANRVSLVIQSFLDLEILAEKLMSSLLDEFSPTLNRPPPTPLSETPDVSVPSYIKPSYDWLVENIHNPYPSPDIRDAIARKSGARRKDVDNWFMNTRRRIGWNDARKTHFANKRADIIDAATRFSANDEKLSLSQGAEHSLISIIKNAKDLYHDRFNETVLATRLDAAVKNLTPETKAEAKAERIRQAQLRKNQDLYPSPNRSPEPARPLTDLCDGEVDNTVTQHISMTSRKRRNLSDQESAELDPCKGSKPEKRARPPDPPSISSCALTVASQKRRLSESDGEVVPKRPRHLSTKSRLQTVSDPLPLSNSLSFDESSFDGWFQQIFDRPEAGGISPSGFAVELGSSPENPGQTPAFEPPILEVADIPPVLDVPWNEFDIGWTDNLSPDNSKQSNSLLNFVGQGPQPQPLAQDLVNFQMSSQGSRSENEFESFFDLSNPSIVDPAVISLNPTSNETWDFPGSTVNRDDPNVFAKHSVDLANNNVLFAPFDFSQGLDFLPSREAISLPTFPQDKVRQKKEREFREAYEKTQRLALELQTDGLFAL
ncbi:hypothetical protein C0995_015195 [Termitomyces sp. Mi166|nr:hypothetical protein C0995_015195 [Termitomyces sp. Mi166\